MRRDPHALPLRLTRACQDLAILPLGAPQNTQKKVSEAIEAMMEAQTELRRLKVALKEQNRMIKKHKDRAVYLNEMRSREREVYKASLTQHHEAVQDLESLIIQLGHGDLL